MDVLNVETPTVSLDLFLFIESQYKGHKRCLNIDLIGGRDNNKPVERTSFAIFHLATFFLKLFYEKKDYIKMVDKKTIRVDGYKRTIIDHF